jgi:ATP-dependent 26S proteasome regulatory subunit
MDLVLAYVDKVVTQQPQAYACTPYVAIVQAVLFEGPPGTGKTTCARIIANQAAIPLINIPLESVASKWYGEGERTLSAMLQTAEAMGGCIIFLDEVCFLSLNRSPAHSSPPAKPKQHRFALCLSQAAV